MEDNPENMKSPGFAAIAKYFSNKHRTNNLKHQTAVIDNNLHGISGKYSDNTKKLDLAEKGKCQW